MPSRNRVKTDLHTNSNSVATREVDDPFYEYPTKYFTRSFPNYTFYEEMNDVVNEGGPQPVTHVSIRYSNNQFSPFSRGYERWSFGNDTRIPFSPDRVVETVPPLPDSILMDWHDRCYKKATVPISADTSVINFLLEMRKGMHELFGFLKELKELRIDKAFLGWQFGTAPGFRDVKKAFLAFQKVRKRLAFLRKTAGKSYVVRFKLDPLSADFGPLRWDPYSEGLSEWHVFEPFEYEPGVRCRYVVENLECHCFCWIAVENNLINLFDKFAELDAMSHALGFDNPVKIIWNALPWSWLADWAVDVEHVLDEMGGHPFEKDNNLFRTGRLFARNMGHSIKYKWTIVVEQEMGSDPGDDLGILWGNRGVVKVKTYSRSSGLNLSSWSFIKGQNLNTDQLAILTALGTSRIGHKGLGSKAKRLKRNLSRWAYDLPRRRRRVRSRSTGIRISPSRK